MTKSGKLTVGLVQLCVGDDPALNLPVTRAFIREAAAAGAKFVLTPEATNLLSPSREWQDHVIRRESEDPTLAALRDDAKALGIWLLIGSLSLRADDQHEDRYINRSLLIDPQGQIVARYDKLHMFDVIISEQESYRESANYIPGNRAMLAQGPAALGLSICYDLRFAHLYRRLAQSGAQILTVPAAFNDTTGTAHWEVLLRARAIETGCFVLAPAQTGTHPATHARQPESRPQPRPRRSWGHSMAVSPWGEVLADGGTEPGMILTTLDLEAVNSARFRIPSLTHDREFLGP